MSNRKIISRPITALLSCVALVFAMLMVVLAGPMGKVSASNGYEPERYISLTDSVENGYTQVNAKLAFNGVFTANETYTVKGYYKLENFASLNDDQGPKVILGTGAASSPVNVTGNTDGWESFELTYTGGSYMYFEFWYASGTLSLGDVTVTDAAGAVVYDLKTDADLVAGDKECYGQDESIWYFGFYGQQDGANAYVSPITTMPSTSTESTASSTSSSNTTETTATTSTTEPTTAPTIPVDPSGYVPNRSVSVVSTTDENPTMRMYLMYDYYMLDGPYYLVGKVKVDGLTAQSGADEAKSYIEFAYSYADSVEVAAYTEDTNGWIDLKGNDGKLISFDNLSEETTGDMELVFGTKGAAGTFSVADLKIVDAAGNIVYSMANDATLYGKGDICKCSKSLCIWDAWDADTDNPTSQFPIRTRGDAEYIPNNVMSINVSEGSNAINPIIFLSTNNELFTAGETYTLTGRMKADITGKAGVSAVERPNCALTGPGLSLHYGTTGGWVAITKDDGTPITFEGTAADNEQRLTWLMWYATGSLSLADIEITDSEGNVVYSMATDPGLQQNNPNYGETLWSGEGSALLISAHFGNADDLLSFGIKVNANPVQHTAADYVVPTFEETVDITDPSTSTSTSDADTTNSTGDVTDPSATNGTDPSNPNTGDSNVLLTIAGLTAVLALAGAFLTLRKKESAE